MHKQKAFHPLLRTAWTIQKAHVIPRGIAIRCYRISRLMKTEGAMSIGMLTGLVSDLDPSVKHGLFRECERGQQQDSPQRGICRGAITYL